MFRRHGAAWRAANEGASEPGSATRHDGDRDCVAPRRSAVMSSAAKTAPTRASRITPAATATAPSASGRAAQREWLEARKAELLPVPYFHVVFTLPAQDRSYRLPEQGQGVWHCCSTAAAEALTTIAADPKHLGAPPSVMTAVLHTWGQNLDHHPACSLHRAGRWQYPPTGDRWVAVSDPSFFLVRPRVLSRLFRRLFLSISRTAAFAGGRASVLLRPRCNSQTPSAFNAVSRSLCAGDRMGGLCQASVRRA